MKRNPLLLLALPLVFGGCALRDRNAAPAVRAAAPSAPATPSEVDTVPRAQPTPQPTEARADATDTPTHGGARVAAVGCSVTPPPPNATQKQLRLTVHFAPSSRGGIVYGRIDGAEIPAELLAAAYLNTDRAYLQSDCVAEVARRRGWFAIPVQGGRAWRSIIVLVIRRDYLNHLAVRTERTASAYLPDGYNILCRATIEREGQK